MKRLFFVCAILLIANCAMAQIITFSSTTKVKPQKVVAPQQHETQTHTKVSKCYDQYINLSYGYNCVSDFFGVNYIGGYRFNHLFFLGLGTGVDFALFAPIMEEKFANCKPTLVNIPVYVNFRTNFLNKAWSPYLSISAGARISPKKIETESYFYNQSGVLGDISFGMERSLGKKSSLYFGIGYRIESFLYFYEFQFKNGFVHGFNAHIGVSF